MGLNQKIAVVCNYELLPDRVGGMDYFFWAFDRKCKANGVQIDWFFPNLSGHGDYPQMTIKTKAGFSPEACFLEQCEGAGYSCVVTHFVELCTPFFQKAKQKTAAKMIGVDHNPRPLQGYPLKKKLEKRLKGFLFSRYIDVLVGVSEYTKSELIKDFGGRIKSKTIVIYNGVLFQDIVAHKGRKLERPDFLVASHLRESKGIQDLIAAVALLDPDLRTGLKIDLYGDGPYKETLLELVRENRLEDHFHFKGSRSDLKEIYCKYDYLLQPTHMECFSLSILESLAANVPVITTSVGGNEEAIVDGQNGFIFKAGDVAGLKNILEKLQSGALHIAQNTREKVQNHFSINQMVDHHYNLIA